VGLGMKLVAAYVLIALVLLELLRWVQLRRRPIAQISRLSGCCAAAAASFVGLIAVCDRVAAPYDDAARKLVGGGVLGHIGHMIRYAAQQTSPNGPQGIASYPWGWLVDYKPIVYLNVNPARPAPGLYQVHPAVHFLGLISPPILLVALPALGVAGWRAIRRRGAPAAELPLLAIAWFAGTFLPFVLLSLVWHRTSYIYYMVIVMPGLYIAATYLVSSLWRLRLRSVSAIAIVWGIAVVAAVVLMYPFVPVF
jgi:hypothetical protein